MSPWFGILAFAWLVGCTSHTTNSVLLQADEAYSEGRYSEAAVLYEEQRQTGGNTLTAILNEADALIKTNQSAAAERILTTALNCDEDDQAHKMLAQLYLDSRQLDKAQASYEYLHANHPDDASFMNRLGVIYDMQGMHDKAQEYYQKALTKTPLDVNYQGNYALSLAYMGHYEEAIALLKPLAADHIKQRHNLAIVYALMQRFDDFHIQLKADLSLPERESLLQTLSSLREAGKQ